jgi:hypothetical protein
VGFAGKESFIDRRPLCMQVPSLPLTILTLKTDHHSISSMAISSRMATSGTITAKNGCGLALILARTTRLQMIQINLAMLAGQRLSLG